MITKLFVYGTLMSIAGDALGHGPRSRLSPESSVLGPAHINGLLYDLGAYPGVVDCSDPNRFVHGEVVELFDPVRTFSWLDLYEGIDPARPNNSEYQRTTRQITCQDTACEAWVYLYRWDVDSMQMIADGRWIYRTE